MSAPVWREREPLAAYTTLHVGGPARYLVTVTSLDELRETVVRAQAQALPFVVIGGGSNVLVSDDGFAGIVIRMAIAGISITAEDDQVIVTAGAGVVFDDLVREMVHQGYWGLENLSHIPGTVGATPIQNVGAYGVEVADVIRSVTVFDVVTGLVNEFTTDDCAFGYRTSRFKLDPRKRYIVTAVTFCLSRSPQPRVSYADLAARFTATLPSTPAAVREVVIAVRSAKFPDWHTIGTAGSFFKNPLLPHAEIERLQLQYPALPCYPHDEQRGKCSLGYILDKICGLRGYREGYVGLYEAQALVLVAARGATAYDINRFADVVAARVQSLTGIFIEREVQSL